MGSQRSERRKWIHSFDDVSAVFFVVALSEFNQVLYEDRKTNRMLESLLVFNEIVNSTYFAGMYLCLYLQPNLHIYRCSSISDI